MPLRCPKMLCRRLSELLNRTLRSGATDKNDAQRGHFDPKFHVEGIAPHQSFLHG